MHAKVLQARADALKRVLPEEPPARCRAPALAARDDEEGVADSGWPLEYVVAAMASERLGLLEGCGSAAADLFGAGLLLLRTHDGRDHENAGAVGVDVSHARRRDGDGALCRGWRRC